METYKVLLCTFLNLLIIASQVKSELFTALVDLERILYAENNVASDLKSYIADEEARLQQLKTLAEDYERHSKEALSNPEIYLSNPVNAFLLVKRFTTDWDNVIDRLIRGNTSQEFLNNISAKMALFPGEEDLTGAANALIRLQDTYALATDKIARGDLQGIKSSPVLTAEECFELGRHAYRNEDFYHTILWMEEAMARWEEESSPSVKKIDILDYLAYSMSMQGNLQEALKLTKELLVYEPDHMRAQNNKAYYEQLIREEEEQRRKGDEGPPPPIRNKRILDEYRQSEEFATYEALCRGENTHDIPDAKSLSCRFKQHSPLFYIDPLREETLYHDPWLVVYHNIMSDKEIARIKDIGIPKLNRATVQNPATGKLEFATYRVSKSAWLKDDEDLIIRRVSQRTKALTNLTLDTVEELQVVNYGIGGHYEPHFDFARPYEVNTFEEWRGNRILTAIFYMSEVTAGGLTVFPSIGAKVYPEKGSVAVWYNLMANGEGDYRTRHAGCPVLTGSKWVANKWFHERGQEFARKCDLDPNL